MKISTNVKTLIVFALLLAVGIAYLSWLNCGCESAGIMTWQGKVCL